MDNLFEKKGAEFSECRNYRYALWRIWDENKPLVMFIGLNPSTANESVPDATITRVERFAKSWGFGGFYMMNCYPAYTLNLFWHNRIKVLVSDVVFCWGSFKEAKLPAETMRKMYPEAKVFKLNKDGSPAHPLYLPKKLTLMNIS